MAHRPTEFPAPAAFLTAFLCVAVPAVAQTPTDPREARPERPTVATHAYAVEPGIVELETGVQWQQPTAGVRLLSSPTLLKIGLWKHVQLDIAPGWASVGPDGQSQTWLSDLVVGVKWQIAAHVPVLSDVSIQPALKLPTGSIARGTGTGTTDVSVLMISSRQVGPVSLDINVGVTARSGDGSRAPTSSTVWTAAAGFPLIGRVQWDAELFGFPGTGGPAGYAPIVAFLTGPTLQVHRSVVLDGGVILNIEGYGGTACYGGVTWNVGRLGRHRPPLPAHR
jgi:hypothetical protein